MALVPQVVFTQVADAGKLYMTDTTGIYSLNNLTGYGSPNTNLAVVTATYVTSPIIYLPDGTSNSYPTVNLYPNSPNLPPYTAYELYLLTPSSFGLTNATLPDGIYAGSYTVHDGNLNEDFSTPFQVLFYANSLCCIQNQLSELCDCGCEGDIDELYNYFMMLEAAKYAVGCNKIQKALGLLNTVVNYCNQNPCQPCGC